VTAFRDRVLRDDVAYFALHKAPGHGYRLFPRLARLFGELRPEIVHTRNLAALEASIPAWYARVPIRVHGEHGRDVGDLDGSNRTYRFVRRMHRPFVTQWVTVSRDLQRYLTDAIGVRASRVMHIVNGVDTAAFRPAPSAPRPPGYPFEPQHWVCGAVGRLQPVKNQTLLAHAFVQALERAPALRTRLRLVIVGDGPLRAEIDAILARGGARDLAWLPGVRDDVAPILGTFDAFVLPSLAEGISNTVLEAMASGLPVIASDVGGNRELIEPGVTGSLVPVGDVDALATRLLDYACDPQAAQAAGWAGRARTERLYSLDAMVAQYTALYDALLRSRRNGERAASAPAAQGAVTRSR